MDVLIREHEEEVAAGRKPVYRFYRWTIFDTGANVPNCRRAPDNAGRPNEELCDCNMIRKGTFEGGRERTFADCCGGRLARAAGWRPLSEIQRKFQENDRQVWEAEYECRRPSTRDNVLPDFSRERHGGRGVKLGYEVGNVYAGIDFGGRAHHHVVWAIVLRQDWQWHGVSGERTLRAGTRLLFDELYRAECGFAELADRVIERETYWRSQFPNFRVTRRWGDAQGTGAIYDFKAKGVAVSGSGKKPQPQISHFYDLVNSDYFAVDVERCPLLIQQLEQWRYAPGTSEPIRGENAFDHGCDATRYMLWGLRPHEPLTSGLASSSQPAASPSPWKDGGTRAGVSPWQGGAPPATVSWDEIRAHGERWTA